MQSFFIRCRQLQQRQQQQQKCRSLCLGMEIGSLKNSPRPKSSRARNTNSNRRIKRLTAHLNGNHNLGRMSSEKTLGAAPCQAFSSAPPSTDEVLVDLKGGFLKHVRLNRPAKFNALNLEMIRELKPQYESWVENKENICVLMTGEGGKAFCAGGDVAHIRENTLAGGTSGVDFFFEEYQLNHCIATAFEKAGIVQISIWDGVTMGGGVGLSLHGKVRIATEKTLFAMPETALGLFPDVGGTFALSRLSSGTSVGVYMALTGCRLGPADCVWSGLATHYVPREKINLLTSSLIGLGEKASDFSTIDSLIKEICGSDKPPSDGKTAPILEPNIVGIQHCFSHDTVEEIFDALEGFGETEQEKKWAQSTLAVLKKCSPLSLKITLEAILKHSGPSTTIGSALSNEYRITQRMLDPNGDFFEGVRAILVDKDNKPSWNHAKIADVSDDLVARYFDPIPQDYGRGELQLK